MSYSLPWPAPTTSVNDAIPIPSRRPSSRASACSRAQLLVAELLEREVASPPGSCPSRRRTPWPTSYGNCSGWMKLSSRNCDGSTPSSCAALSTRRSIRYEASVTRNEQRYATPPGALFVYAAVGHDVRGRDVVRAGDDVEQPGPELRRLRVGVERALVGEERRPQAGHLPALDRQLAAHVVVAREAGRDQVPGAVLDPLHRPPDQERGGRRDDVARVDRHLVAEAAAEVRA